jgi:hypothetical protein
VAILARGCGSLCRMIVLLVGKVEVELRLSVQLELSTVVGKSPIFTLGVTNQSTNRYVQDLSGAPRVRGCGSDPSGNSGLVS